MSLIAAAVMTALKASDLDESAPKFEVCVSFMSKQGPLPLDLALKLAPSNDGSLGKVGMNQIDALGDRLSNLHVVEELARPKMLLNVGSAGTIMSYLGDDDDKKGLGYTAKVASKGTGYEMDLHLGDPSKNGLTNSSHFNFDVKSGESVLVVPKRTICGMPVYAVVQVNKVEQEVEVIVAH